MPAHARAAATTVATGVSSCSSRTPAPCTAGTSTSAAVTSAFAPGTTTIRFSPPSASTGMVALPVGTPGVARTSAVSTPASRRAVS